MDKEKLEQEQAELKVRLAELVDFINSEEYYKLDEREKMLLGTQRYGMEMYINSLSMRLWGERDVPNSSAMMGGLLASMLMPPPSAFLPKTELKAAE